MAGKRRNDPFWNGWFWSGDWDPKTTLLGKPYVFFTDLASKGMGDPNSGVDIAIDAASQGLFALDSAGKPQYRVTSNEQYIPMLENIIAVEREKETSFLQWMRGNQDIPTKLKDLANEGNWVDFVGQYNAILGENMMMQDYVRNYIMNMEDISRNANPQEFQQSSTYYRTATTEANTRLRSFLESYYGITRKSKVSTFNQELLNIIYNTVGSKLLQWRKDEGLVIDVNLLDKAVEVVGEQALQRIEAEVSAMRLEAREKEKAQGKAISTHTISRLDALHNMDMVKYIDDLLDTKGANAMGHILRDERIAFFNAEKHRKSNKLRADEKRFLEARDFEKLFTKIGRSMKVQKVKVVPQYTQHEINSVIRAYSAGLIAQHTGLSNAKPDSIYTTQIQVIPEKQDEVYQTVQDILKQYAKGLKSTNTAEYGEKRFQDTQKTIAQLNKVMEKLKRQNQLLNNKLFLIENSDKFSDRIASGHKNGEFKGGSLGPNLEDILKKIKQILDAYNGANNTMTINQLEMAILNCGEEMMGAKYKTRLEEYLASFCSMLMFDGYISIADRTRTQALQEISVSEVQQIHLFTFGASQVVPLSVVLEHCLQFYKYELDLIENLGELGNSNYATRVYITNTANSAPFSPRRPLTENDWNQAAKEVEQQIRIKVTLATGFIGILQQEADRLLS